MEEDVKTEKKAKGKDKTEKGKEERRMRENVTLRIEKG